MHAALGGMHIVGKGENRLAVPVVVLQGHLCHGVVLLSGHVDHAVVENVFIFIQPCDKLPDSALVAHGIVLFFSGALIHRADPESCV